MINDSLPHTCTLPSLESAHIAVIGLGYVGLPLAVAFGKVYPTIGFDIDSKRIEELQTGIDNTQEVNKEDILQASQLYFCAVARKRILCELERIGRRLP